MFGGEKKLWENLRVVWQDWSGRWVLSTVVSHHASADQSAPRRVSCSEIVYSMLRIDTRVLGEMSFEEAILRTVVEEGGRLWRIKDGRRVHHLDYPSIDEFELVQAEFS